MDCTCKEIVERGGISDMVRINPTCPEHGERPDPAPPKEVPEIKVSAFCGKCGVEVCPTCGSVYFDGGYGRLGEACGDKWHRAAHTEGPNIKSEVLRFVRTELEVDALQLKALGDVIDGAATEGPSPFCDKCGYHTENCTCHPALADQLYDTMPDFIRLTLEEAAIDPRVYAEKWASCITSPPEVTEEMVERVLGFEAAEDTAGPRVDDWLTVCFGGRDTPDAQAHIEHVRGTLRAALQKGG